ncbi:MAG: ABC transporter ATP-binding protein [Spirochaetales bacterium]|nr:ABC transporter ATP-binding protein [Spirochaetales bacterium]
MIEKALCSCDGLGKRYGRLGVLSDCSFLVGKGELVGLVGENGSGKSTLVKCLLKFTRPSKGILSMTESVGYCPQDDYLNGQLTVHEHFALLRSVYSMRYSIDITYVDSLFDRLNIGPFLRTIIGNVSSGTYQKVKLITALLHKPQLLLLDEPYDGFDWQMYLRFWDIIGELKESNAGILMVSHLVYDFERFDRVYELSGGTLHDANRA